MSTRQNISYSEQIEFCTIFPLHEKDLKIFHVFIFMLQNPIIKSKGKDHIK